MHSTTSPAPSNEDRALHPVFVLFMAWVALSPLPLGGYRPIPWTFNALALAVILLLWVFISLRSGVRPRISFGRLAVPALLGAGLAAWMGIQSLLALPEPWAAPLWAEAYARLTMPVGAEYPISINPEAGVANMLRFLVPLGTFLLAAQLGRSRQRAAGIFRIMAFMGLGYALYGLIMHLGGFNLVLWWERWAYTDSVTSTFVNRNHYATFAGLGLLCVAGLLGHSLFRHGGPGDLRGLLDMVIDLLERHLWLALAACVIFSALVMSHSRAGLAAALAAMTALVILLAWTRRGGRASVYKGLGVMLIALLPLLLTMGEETAQRVNDLSLESESRDDLFRLTLQAIGDSPSLGHGAGSFPDAFRMYRDRSLSTGVKWTEAHNSYLEFAFEMGVPALLALLAMFLWVGTRLFIGLGTRRRDQYFAAVGLASLVLVGLHAILDFSVQLPGVAIPFATILGVAYAQSWPSRRRRSR